VCVCVLGCAGGQIVTVFGRNFGHVDTSPVIFLAGRICLESFWALALSNVLNIVPFYSEHTRAVTFENVTDVFKSTMWRVRIVNVSGI
jgi:hypothetical protein